MAETQSNGGQYPSIFNDVIGPVMRGPSSSHCAAAVRIGRIARDLMDGRIETVLIEYDVNGSLAYTHESQGSDMGLFGGFLGRDAGDDRLVHSAGDMKKAGIDVEIKISDFGANHPNTYRLTLINASEQHTLIALSTGGGMIKAVEIDGAAVDISGDYFETLIYIEVESDAEAITDYLYAKVDADEIRFIDGGAARFVEVKSQSFLADAVHQELKSNFSTDSIKRLSPVLPVLSSKTVRVPFTNTNEMIQYGVGAGLGLWELAVRYEAARGNLSHKQVVKKMRGIVAIMEAAVQGGLQGTQYEDRILGNQSGRFLSHLETKRLLDGGILNRMILYATATMEVKSAMGVIVAAPTAGSCGVLPGAILGAAKEMGCSTDDITRAMLAAGMIGILIAARSTFAAEVCGCQAECGAGSGMAAAALVNLAGGTAEQAVAAASMALQNIFGMTCDPVANRVEVPCLGKNIMAVSNALACANMAMADYDAVIPLDEVIEAMDKVGRSIPNELRCTAQGGLSVTRTARTIDKKLNPV